jgi:hypothetical protein
VKAISSAVMRCVKRGMPPFTLCCVSQNGFVHVVRYTLSDASRALDPSLIVNHENVTDVVVTRATAQIAANSGVPP